MDSNESHIPVALLSSGHSSISSAQTSYTCLVLPCPDAFTHPVSVLYLINMSPPHYFSRSIYCYIHNTIPSLPVHQMLAIPRMNYCGLSGKLFCSKYLDTFLEDLFSPCLGNNSSMPSTAVLEVFLGQQLCSLPLKDKS